MLTVLDIRFHLREQLAGCGYARHLIELADVASEATIMSRWNDGQSIPQIAAGLVHTANAGPIDLSLNMDQS